MTAPLLQIDGPIATLTFNRPLQRNRLENEDLSALLAHFDAVQHNPEIHILVLTANTTEQRSPVFCAGYDIGGFATEGQGASRFEQVVETLAQLRPITVCALNGSVYGGATDLVLACDVRMAIEGIVWRMPAVALGLHYYPSGLQRYVSHFGVAAAKRAFLTARAMDIAQLQALGLFEAVVPAAQLPHCTAELLADMEKLSPRAAQATKQSLNELAQAGHNARTHQRLLERQLASTQSADFLEGVQAFAEKRPAVFKRR